MEPKIIIHNDFCTNTNSADIQIILSAVTELIAEAILRSTAEQDDLEILNVRQILDVFEKVQIGHGL